MANETLQALSSGEVAQAFIDHMGGAAYIKTYAESSGAQDTMVSQLTQYLERNVNYFVNAGVVEPEDAKRRKIISAEGFPSFIDVNYTFISPGGYTPWSSTEDREVKQVVLHSFGHQWHAFQSAGKWFGVMNMPDQTTLKILDEEGKKLTWVPKGTNFERGMEHKGRLAAALNACMLPTPGMAGAHFIISRSGDLYVMADCNDVLNSCQDCSPTAISIALEEALYMEVETGNLRPEATWLPTGSPLGTDGSLKYWDFSTQQYLTLAVLIKKLQVAYPAIATSTHTASPGEGSSSFTGYTMHSHLQGADSRYIDVSPHLQSDSDWTILFDLVAAQTQIDQTKVWRPATTGYESRLAWAEDLVTSLQNLGSTGVLQRLTTNPALVPLLGVLRAHREFQNNAENYRQAAATSTAKSSSFHKVQAAMGQAVDRGFTSALSVPTKADGPSECEWDL